MFDFLFKLFEFFRAESVNNLIVVTAAATHELVIQAIMNLVLFALNKARVGKISAVVALMIVLCHLLPIGHDFDRQSLVFWITFQEFLNIISCFQFIFQEPLVLIPQL